MDRNLAIQNNHRIPLLNKRQTREIEFEFRSPEAQGLLLYHTLRNPPPDEPKYELYVRLEGGELKTVHVFGANETTLLVGKGLNILSILNNVNLLHCHAEPIQ